MIPLLALVYHVRYFDFDASADTLVVQGDPALEKYNRMAELFGGDDFVVLAYANSDIFTDQALVEIQHLQQQINQLDGVASTWSILDAPLIESPPIPLKDLAEGYRTLLDQDVDRELARAELTSSPLFKNYLISATGDSTAISATLSPDRQLHDLQEQRDQYRRDNHPDLDRVEQAYRQQRDQYVSNREQLINNLRGIRNSYQGDANLYISGVPMIAADMLAYVRSDIVVFGGLVLGLIVLLLTLFFRKPRWVLIPLLLCSASVAATMGVLGLLRTPVTVVSSNFISLMAIISISFSIHLIVRYRELLAGDEDMDHRERVKQTMRTKFAPCLYTALTTVLAFGSMMGSRILPVEDFGWMMCSGIIISLVLTFTLFPAVLLLMGASAPSRTIRESIALTAWFQHVSTDRPWQVVTVSILIVPVVAFGLSLLTFDNRFTDYFAENTDIHEGMVHIDEHLGGTLPLDIYVQFEPFETSDDPFFDTGSDTFPERYWFTPGKIDTMADVAAHLDERPEIGKMLSLASMERLARQFNDGEPLNGLQIAGVLGELPLSVREFLIEPYADPATGWMRLNARIQESTTKFSKQDLIDDVSSYLKDDLNITEDRFIVTGMVVLFNDMLQQLADSQSRTLGYVIGATFLMFIILLRSIPMAVMAIVPNVLAALIILAVMGYAGIPMDMMTITIAAICIGIGVDDAIHYMHRFREEYDASKNARSAVTNAHKTIGRAMYFTTMTIMGGFSILAFSNFIPTVYFGLLTALAMLIALTANMALMPSLLLLYYRYK